MKILKTFSDESEVHLAKNLLAANGIEAQILGAKDYATHVIGGGTGRYQLLVNWQDVNDGQRILASVATSTSEPLAPDYFRRAVFYAFAATVVLPLVFNIVSLLNAKYFWRNSARDRQSALKLALIFLLQLPGLTLAVFLLSLFVPSAHAMDAFEIQVYDSEINEVGKSSIETHLNSVIQGKTDREDSIILPQNHLTHLTFEVAYGLTRNLELGAYLQSAWTPNAVYRYAGSKLRLKWVVPRLESAPFLLGANMELSDVPAQFESERYATELRPILGYTTERWLFLINPILGISLTQGTSNAPDFSPAAKIMYGGKRGIGLGLEYYSDFGPPAQFATFSHGEQYLFTTIDWLNAPIELDVGLGHGLTAQSNDWVGKLICGVDL